MLTIMSITEIKEAAAGTITRAKPPKTWDNKKKDPVNQWINADFDQREKIAAWDSSPPTIVSKSFKELQHWRKSMPTASLTRPTSWDIWETPR
eukprot:scaffold15425_cov62-Attheya_sp.AAC.2